MKLRTCWRTCLWASAACLKSFHISSLALSNTRFSSLVVRRAALRLGGETSTIFNKGLEAMLMRNFRQKQADSSGCSEVKVNVDKTSGSALSN